MQHMARTRRRHVPRRAIAALIGRVDVHEEDHVRCEALVATDRRVEDLAVAVARIVGEGDTTELSHPSKGRVLALVRCEDRDLIGREAVLLKKAADDLLELPPGLARPLVDVDCRWLALRAMLVRVHLHATELLHHGSDGARVTEVDRERERRREIREARAAAEDLLRGIVEDGEAALVPVAEAVLVGDVLAFGSMGEPPDLGLPKRIALADPAPFLAAVTATPWSHANLDDLETVEMWALVALCALARRERAEGVRCDVYHRGASNAARFAHAIGFDAAREGGEPAASEIERTVPIQRVTIGQARVAERIARLAVPSDDESESRGALAYVIDELLRNVLQHSGDPLGAVVGAQRMAPGRGGYTRDTVQVVVADTGRGILESLRRFHDVPTAEAALEKAIRPHISGTFPEGQTGSLDNAGLGLFFTSEMAKLTAGRFLLATRGAALLLTSDEDAGTHHAQLLLPPGTGFPGTLAVFELPPLESGVTRDTVLDVIRRRADERTPGPETRRWLSYEPPPPQAERMVVRECGDDPASASAFGERIRVAVSAGRPIVIDFGDVGIATQSFLHALLFQAVRVGWAMGATIHVVNASSAVRSGLDYLESYALK